MSTKLTALTALTALVLLCAAPLPALAEPIVAPEADVDWRTPAERCGFRSTPDLAETEAFIRRLADRWSGIDLRYYGTSAAGRAMPLVVVSNGGHQTPTLAATSGKAIILVQNGIHAGEIDGKDATLMLLRDLALGQHREWLEEVVLLFLPVYNVDGHERISPYNRPNQFGPVEGMGFRTTADGHDLNRDHMKLDTPEGRAVVDLFNRWQPHLHIDNHVTNGVDHDWVLTYSWVEGPQAPAPIDGWLTANMRRVIDATRAAGIRLGPYVSLIDGNDPTQGFNSYVGRQYFATGYYPLRNVPSILVENHAHKPYEDRVRANLAFMVALFDEVTRDKAALITAVRAARRRTVDVGRPDAEDSNITVRWKVAAATEKIRFPVYDWHLEDSVVSGAPLVRYRSGEVREVEVPWLHRPEPDLVLPRPRGYVVLPGWPEIQQRLNDHGLAYRTLPDEIQLDVETLRIGNPRPASNARPTYQGRTPIGVDVERSRERRTVPRGTLWIPADQPDFEVAVQLFEPEALDSLVSWGLLSIVLERKEYIGPRKLDEIAREQLRDPAVAAEWRKALADETFAADGFARYLWWYRRTQYWDDTVGMLPIMRVMGAPPAAF